MSEKDQELSEEELKAAAGGKQTRQAPPNRIILVPGEPANKDRKIRYNPEGTQN